MGFRFSFIFGSPVSSNYPTNPGFVPLNSPQSEASPHPYPSYAHSPHLYMYNTSFRPAVYQYFPCCNIAVSLVLQRTPPTAGWKNNNMCIKPEAKGSVTRVRHEDPLIKCTACDPSHININVVRTMLKSAFRKRGQITSTSCFPLALDVESSRLR